MVAVRLAAARSGSPGSTGRMSMMGPELVVVVRPGQVLGEDVPGDEQQPARLQIDPGSAPSAFVRGQFVPVEIEGNDHIVIRDVVPLGLRGSSARVSSTLSRSGKRVSCRSLSSSRLIFAFLAARVLDVNAQVGLVAEHLRQEELHVAARRGADDEDAGGLLLHFDRDPIADCVPCSQSARHSTRGVTARIRHSWLASTSCFGIVLVLSWSGILAGSITNSACACGGSPAGRWTPSESARGGGLRVLNFEGNFAFWPTSPRRPARR